MGIVGLTVPFYDIEQRVGSFYFNFKVLDRGGIIFKFFKAGINSAGEAGIAVNRRNKAGLVELGDGAEGYLPARALFFIGQEGSANGQIGNDGSEVSFPI